MQWCFIDSKPFQTGCNRDNGRKIQDQCMTHETIQLTQELSLQDRQTNERSNQENRQGPAHDVEEGMIIIATQTKEVGTPREIPRSRRENMNRKKQLSSRRQRNSWRSPKMTDQRQKNQARKMKKMKTSPK